MYPFVYLLVYYLMCFQIKEQWRPCLQLDLSSPNNSIIYLYQIPFHCSNNFTIFMRFVQFMVFKKSFVFLYYLCFHVIYLAIHHKYTHFILEFHYFEGSKSSIDLVIYQSIYRSIYRVIYLSIHQVI